MRVWSPEEARRFVELARKDRLYALWFLLLTTGMRRGEAVGLRWADVDFAAGVLSVRRAISSADGMAVEMEPKTAKSRRAIALDPATIEALRQHRERQEAERALVGDGWTEWGAVFTYPDGCVLHPDHVMVVFRGLVTCAGLPVIRLHDMRHPAATLAIMLLWLLLLFGCRRASQGRARATRTLEHQHHARHVLPRRPGDAGGRSGKSRSDPRRTQRRGRATAARLSQTAQGGVSGPPQRRCGRTSKSTC